MTPTIKFGTDGWRALIARDFTFENVSLVARAVSKTMRKKLPDRNKMIVGYDRRFLSRQFAETASVIYSREGFDVLFSETFLPTPAYSWCAKYETGAVGATVITASHNPPEWNGFKFKEIFGGSASPTITKAFEEEIVRLASTPAEVPSPEDFGAAVKAGKIKVFNPKEPYFGAVLKQIDTDRIRKAKLKVVLDVMHGSASGHYAELLRSLGVTVEELHGENNPGFRGVAPEPIGKNLGELCEAVKRTGADCGLATDGDADRLGAVDETGTYFTTQQILSVAYWHMLKNRGKKWSIARSVSTTRMVDLVARRAGFTCFETPVGFKFIAEKMVAGEAHIGGEESGGIGIMDHIPERDGPLTGLLLLELMATTGKGLKAAYEALCKEERPYYFTRHDLHMSPAQATAVVKRLKENAPKAWDGRPVESLLTIDGFKFFLKDGGWVLIRPSGTEPIFRLYSEAESVSASEKLIAACRQFIETA